MSAIKIVGNPLYQWEIGRKIQIIQQSNMRIDEVHFSNYGDTKALVVMPREEDGIVVADIPNVLMQSGRPIVVYSVNVAEGYSDTLYSCTFNVRNRAKPSDYVYTETECKNWEDIKAQVEENTEAIKELEEREVDLTEYATKEYVNNSFNKEWELVEEIVADGTSVAYQRNLAYYGLNDASAILLECIYPITPIKYGIYNSITFNPLVSSGNITSFFSWGETRTDKQTRFAMLVDKENALFLMRNSDAVSDSSVGASPNGNTVIIDKFNEIKLFGFSTNNGSAPNVPDGTIIRIYIKGGVSNA